MGKVMVISMLHLHVDGFPVAKQEKSWAIDALLACTFVQQQHKKMAKNFAGAMLSIWTKSTVTLSPSSNGDFNAQRKNHFTVCFSSLDVFFREGIM